jgi:hypothetical protein
MFFMASAFILLPGREGLAQDGTFRAAISVVKIEDKWSAPGARVVGRFSHRDFQHVVDAGKREGPLRYMIESIRARYSIPF